MKKFRIGLVIISLLLLTALVSITTKFFDVETTRDVILGPALVISLYLTFKSKKQ